MNDIGLRRRQRNMYLIFEFLFYLGLTLLGIGVIWTWVTMLRRRWHQLKYPATLMFLGIAAIATPAIYTRFAIIDLGPRLELVGGEKHITLTGWDGESYAILDQHPETIVLQMANADVTDQTLTHIRSMANLRELDLNDSQVTDVGMSELAKLTALEVLRLRGTKITDAGLREHLSRLPDLQRLDVRATAVTKEAVEAWKAAGEKRRAFH